MNQYVKYDNIIPLLEPKDIGTTITASSYMNIKGANAAAFLIIFGAVTSACADTEVVTVEAATAEGAAEAAIAFSYRLSGALGDNTWGAITAVANTGLAIDPAADDNKMLWIEVDPEVVHAIKADANYIRVRLTDTTDMAACLVCVLGIIDPIYKQATHVSATASASS